MLSRSTISFSSFLFFLDRIRLYKSGSRGSLLKKVAKNFPDATQLLQKFKGGTSKRVYIILKNDNENGGTNIWLFHLLTDTWNSFFSFQFYIVLYANNYLPELKSWDLYQPTFSNSRVLRHSITADTCKLFDSNFLTTLPFGQPVLLFGCPPSKDLLPIKTQRKLVKISILCKTSVKWVCQTNVTPAVCPWCSSSLHSFTSGFELSSILSRLVCFLILSKLVEIALQKVEFSYALVRCQSIYIWPCEDWLIVTNILFVRRKMVPTNMFLFPVCFEVVPSYF